MRGFQGIAAVALGCLLAGTLVADESRPARTDSWCVRALASIVSGHSIDDAKDRYERADRFDRIERRKWEEIVSEDPEKKPESPLAAKPAGFSGPVAVPLAGKDEVAKPQGNRAEPNSVAARSTKKPVGAVPGNPTGKRVKRKTPIDDGAAPTTIILRPW